jgi:TolB protein
MEMKKSTETWAVLVIALIALILVGAMSVYAQHAGVATGSVVFHSARDGHANNQIYVMPADGSPQIRVTYDQASDVDPDISPNGHELVFTSGPTGSADILLLDRFGRVRNLTKNPADDEWARWSPNGREIVFGSNRDSGVYEVFVMNVRTGDTRQVTAPPLLSRYASWSPDGQQLVFRQGIDIVVANADGSGTPTQLTQETAPRFAQMPVFSPDGKYIAFMSTRLGYCSVFLMNADGSGQMPLTVKTDPNVTNAAWCSRAPSWSADGQQIYFMSSRSGGNQVYVMNMDGSNLHQLTSDGTSGSPRARVHYDDDSRDGDEGEQ